MRYHEYLAAGYLIATGLMLSGSPVALSAINHATPLNMLEERPCMLVIRRLLMAKCTKSRGFGDW